MKLNIGLFTLSLIFCTTGFTESSDLQKNTANDALHLNWMDTNVSPAQDFYAYANGSWQKNNPIPADYSTWGSFNIVNDKIQDIIHQMLIQVSENTKGKEGSVEQKVGDFYFSGMNETSINQLGLTPLKSEFEQIDAVKNLEDLQREIIHLHQIGVDAIFGFGSMQDFKDSTAMIGALVQGGLSLPDRDYYLKDDAKFKKIRAAYVDHLTKMFVLLGDNHDKARHDAKTVMDIETKLAKASMSQVEQRDPHAVYHMMGISKLNETVPNFAWSQYLVARGQSNLKNINLAMPNFFKAINGLLTSVTLDEWKVYLRWHLLDSFAAYLSKPFVDQNFKMVSVLTGAEKILPRWKRVVATENGVLGFAIGKMYVENYFSANSKQEVLEILKNIRTVFVKISQL